jgi:mannitol 2-dehydrogenase
MARDTMSSDVTSEPVELKRASLSALPASVRVPAYDHAAVAPGIVHLGLGGFHRAHMARYTHDLMQLDPSAREWGIAGAGLMPSDRRMIDSLAPQDGLYTLVERSGTEETACVIGSIAEVIFAGESSAALLSAIDRPAIRIVSLTVTENGYCLDPATKQLNPEHPLVRADLADPARPKSAIGIIVEALRRRRDGGRPPFTALTCDNIQGNGEVLREAVLGHPLLRDAELADWIAREVSFPSTMVDRITPVTAAEEIETLATRHGVRDRWPVFCETFTQWVIEDRFPLGRPAWERVGAQFVDDVAPYEFMKLRLLNASHLAVSGLGRLAGYVTIDGSMADPRIAGIMAALMDRETGPTLPPVPGIDLPAYKRTLIERFANPAIKDTVARVNDDAPLNVLVDPIRDRLKAGASVELLALALAAWLRRVRGEDEHGAPIPVRHPMAELLRAKAVEGGPDPTPLLSIRPLFGELGADPRLIEAVRGWLGLLYASGIEATLDEATRRIGS